jgi:hypothetical protein
MTNVIYYWRPSAIAGMLFAVFAIVQFLLGSWGYMLQWLGLNIFMCSVVRLGM